MAHPSNAAALRNAFHTWDLVSHYSNSSLVIGDTERGISASIENTRSTKQDSTAFVQGQVARFHMNFNSVISVALKCVSIYKIEDIPCVVGLSACIKS